MGDGGQHVVELPRLLTDPQEQAGALQTGVTFEAGVGDGQRRGGDREHVGSGHQLQFLAAPHPTGRVEGRRHARNVGMFQRRAFVLGRRDGRHVAGQETAQILGGVEAVGRDEPDTRDDDAHARYRPTASVPLLPPKPKALDSATSTRVARASPGT